MKPRTRRVLKGAVFVLCLVPLARTAIQLGLGQIHGEWIKEITHRTGFWGLTFITLTLAVTPLRRITGWNSLQNYRRMLGLYGFTYITVHFLIYVFLDRQIFLDPLALTEVGGDIAKRPYVTVGFTGWLLMIPLALTSTAAMIRRLGKKWVPLHSLVYVTALAGVVHFTWSVKADLAVPTRYALTLLVLLALRFVPRSAWPRRKRPPQPSRQLEDPVRP